MDFDYASDQSFVLGSDLEFEEAQYSDGDVIEETPPRKKQCISRDLTADDRDRGEINPFRMLESGDDVAVVDTNTITFYTDRNPHNMQTRLAKMKNLLDAEKAKERKHKNYVFVINNYTDDCWELICNKMEAGKAKFIYSIIAKEVGANGTPHIQGYIAFVNSTRYSTMQNFIGYKQHGCYADLEVAHKKACDMHQQKYCKKGSQSKVEYNRHGIEGPDYGKNAIFKEWGTPRGTDEMGQGCRTDIHEAVKDIVENAFTDDEITVALKNPRMYMQCNSAVLRLRGLVQMRDNPAGEERANGHYIEWIIGVTGAGKSHYVREQTKGKNVYMKGKGKWYDYYSSVRDSILWLDDYRKNWMEYGELLKVLDIHNLPVQFKGGMTRLRVSKTYITCPVHPAVLYGKSQDNCDQLIRRIYQHGGKIIEMKRETNNSGHGTQCAKNPCILSCKHCVRWSEPQTAEDAMQVLADVKSGKVQSWAEMKKSSYQSANNYAPNDGGNYY
jgi:hypothetical protein